MPPQPKSPSSPASPARTAPTWPSCCSTRATRCTASSAAPSLFNTDRIDHLYQDPHVDDQRFILHYGDLTDSHQPDPHHPAGAARRDLQPGGAEPRRGELREPEYTANADGIGTLRLLEAIRILGLEKKTRFYQATTSRAVRPGAGNAAEGDHARSTRAAPTRWPSSTPTGSPSTTARPTACTPATASCSTTRARCAARPSSRARSPARMARIALGLQDCLYLGNLDALRDWGHAKRLRRDAVADAAAGRSPRTSSSPPACSTACASSSRWRRAELGITLRVRGRRRAARSAPSPRSTATRRTCKPGDVIVQGRPALLPPDRGRDAARRREQGQAQARLDAEDQPAELVREMVEADYDAARARQPGQERRLPGL